MDVFKVFKQLHKIYGPQGWWPIIVGTELKYGINYRNLKNFENEFRDPYFEIAIGAILTQNTAWKNVAKAICNLHQAKSLKPELIIKLNTRRLQTLVKPAGYYKQKAKKLKIFSKWLIENYNGDISKLKKHQLDRLRSKLLDIWGIGKETADSIMLYALNRPIFMIDEYTRRLCHVFAESFPGYDNYRHFFESKLSKYKSAKFFQEYHALIVASGQEKHQKIKI